MFGLELLLIPVIVSFVTAPAGLVAYGIAAL